ncbi:MAG: 5'/3'-nucleotidase SurE, partial [Bacteroidales bacterium]|nr:5'/3'-nucleotidase SurE [Bacteroidales bacterium]
MSGTSHAITVRHPLRLHLVTREEGYQEYSCNGTPVDCVKLGEQVVLKSKPDLLVSGINHGSNASINIVYSGTMAAVLESAIGGVPSIGFSLMDYSHQADFSACTAYVRTIAQKVLANGLPDGVCLNVNIPAVNHHEIKGVKVCRQGRSKWVEEFDTRTDPHKHDYYWLTGYFEKLEENEDTDQWALENNYISLVPVHFDLTAHYALSTLQQWEFDAEKG